MRRPVCCCRVPLVVAVIAAAVLIDGAAMMGGGSPLIPRGWAQQLSSPQPARSWQLGAKLEQQLALPVGITWSSLPLRDALVRLGETHELAILLDRRIDPNQTIDFESSQQSLDATLRKLAAQLDADTGRIGPVVYLGPRGETDRIATCALLRADEVEKLPAAQQARWRATAAWNWPQLATPGELLEQLAQENQIRWEGLEQIPHDLWPATDLPPMTLADRLSLVLAGFGQTYTLESEGQVARIVPLPESARKSATYASTGMAKGEVDSLVAEFRRTFPKARLQQRGDRLTLEGSWREHQQLQTLLDASRPSGSKGPGSKGPVQQRYTLRVENKAVGSIARQLAEKLNRRLDVDPRATDSLRKLVSFEVKDATLDGLLKAVFSPAGLQFEVDDQRIHVLPP